MAGQRIIFYPNLAFGILELRDQDGEVPAWLIDRPEVLEALLLLAKDGGTAELGRAPDWADVIVDLASGTVSYEEGHC